MEASTQFTFLFYLFLAICQLPFSTTFDCNSENGEKLQVHLVPHTHDDVGWLKTVDEYFYGANKSIQDAAVQYILDTVITELQKNPNRTFIYVEMAFFKRWWDQQDDDVRKIVKSLVAKKQLEFINGGWCMNDEAATHYNAIIDQMTLGLRFIDENFGSEARPTVAWHIDPFGHSAEQASLFSLMSFDGFFFGRIDEQDKQKRLKEQRMEMMWRGSRNYGKASQIFTGVNYNGYGPPGGFCFDDYCSDPPIQDDPRLFDNNVKERVDLFVKETCEQAASYKTNNIMLTMGSDFQYQNALKWFKNMDKLMKYVNKDGRVNAFYSTPSRYLKALHDAKKEWEVKTDDFFPYAHCDHCYWTGYFTSRPALKAYIRESNSMLQVCKQMETQGLRDPKTQSPSSETLRRAMAVNQHHDAVTGTEKQHVAYDYAKRLSMGREECKNLMSNFLQSKVNPKEQKSSLKFQYCDFLNISICGITQTEKSIIMNYYNPLARPISSYVRLPVSSNSYTVSGPDGKSVPAQVSSIVIHSPFELVFKASAPALGYATYFIEKQSIRKFKRSLTVRAKPTKKNKKNQENFIENKNLRIDFSPDTGRIIRISRKDIKLGINVDQQFFWYNGSQGNDVSRQTSGAYIFRPNRTTPYKLTNGNVANIEVVKGALVQELRQFFNPFVSQVIRLYQDAVYAEFEYTVGHIPVGDHLGKEIITRFDTDIKSGGKFYTDANGREMKERIRNHRDTWNLTVTEPVSGNYYPVNSRIFINDTKSQLTILNDRSQGGSSIKDGQVEVMLHRRLLVDDFLGVGEPLNEPGVLGAGLVIKGIHRVLLTSPEEGKMLHRMQGQELLLQPSLSFSSKPLKRSFLKGKLEAQYSGLAKPIPNNVHLLTMEMVQPNTLLLRFENFFEAFENNKTATVDLNGLFKEFKVVTLTEMNLSANQLIKDKKMWDWNTNETQYHYLREPMGFKNEDYEPIRFQSDLVISLKPMEIKTYIAEIQKQ